MVLEPSQLLCNWQDENTAGPTSSPGSLIPPAPPQPPLYGQTGQPTDWNSLGKRTKAVISTP